MALLKDTIKLEIQAISTSLNAGDPTEQTAVENEDAWADALADVIINAIKSASISVPGLGLVAPSGGGPVTGSSTTGGLS